MTSAPKSMECSTSSVALEIDLSEQNLRKSCHLYVRFPIRFESEVPMLRNWYLYTFLISMREWPTKDFGTLIDHFGTYTGMKTIALIVNLS